MLECLKKGGPYGPQGYNGGSKGHGAPTKLTKDVRCRSNFETLLFRVGGPEHQLKGLLMFQMDFQGQLRSYGVILVGRDLSDLLARALGARCW